MFVFGSLKLEKLYIALIVDSFYETLILTFLVPGIIMNQFLKIIYLSHRLSNLCSADDTNNTRVIGFLSEQLSGEMRLLTIWEIH